MDTVEEPGTSPFPARMLDHKQTDLEIPNHCRLNSSCINFYREFAAPSRRLRDQADAEADGAHPHVLRPASIILAGGVISHQVFNHDEPKRFSPIRPIEHWAPNG